MLSITAVGFLPLFPSTQKVMTDAFLQSKILARTLVLSLSAVLPPLLLSLLVLFSFLPFSPHHPFSTSLFFHLDSILKKKSIKFHKTPLYFIPDTWSSGAVSVSVHLSTCLWNLMYRTKTRQKRVCRTCPCVSSHKDTSVSLWDDKLLWSSLTFCAVMTPRPWVSLFLSVCGPIWLVVLADEMQRPLSFTTLPLGFMQKI